MLMLMSMSFKKVTYHQSSAALTSSKNEKTWKHGNKSFCSTQQCGDMLQAHTVPPISSPPYYCVLSILRLSRRDASTIASLHVQLSISVYLATYHSINSKTILTTIFKFLIHLLSPDINYLQCLILAASPCTRLRILILSSSMVSSPPKLLACLHQLPPTSKVFFHDRHHVVFHRVGRQRERLCCRRMY
jgi:hypothetical protein